MKLRAGQREFERGCNEHRVCALVARRQYGKTTIAARIALRRMLEMRNHTVIFASVKLDLGREIIRHEAALLRAQLSELRRLAERRHVALQLVDARKEIPLPELSPDDFTELYEAQRLELRLYHGPASYSRTKVVALSASTVGETGDLITDEVGRVRSYAEVIEAAAPIIAARPDYRWVITTTPPPDDTHASYTQLAPDPEQIPRAREGEATDPEGWPVRPQGNWYISQSGVHVLRVTAYDAYADGLPLYDDDTGDELTPEQSRMRAMDKTAWDRNYACAFRVGGTAACSTVSLDTAQRRGTGQCRFVEIEHESDLDTALQWLRTHIGDGPVAVGLDLATSERDSAHPTACAVVERRGVESWARLITVWHTADPSVCVERVRRILRALKQRSSGGARRLCVDATSERYFAESLRRELNDLVPVELVNASATADVPGFSERMTMSQYIGGMTVSELEDARLVLPPERYVREDWRLVRKDRGRYIVSLGAEGQHADTWVAVGLALWGLRTGSGRPTVSPARIGRGLSASPTLV